jgi:hypothetical protein
MKNKHTPETWQVPQGFDDTVATNIRPDPEGPTGIIWDTIAEGLSPDDARLIAQAPELLKVCSNTLVLLKQLGELTLNQMSTIDQIEQSLKQVISQTKKGEK